MRRLQGHSQSECETRQVPDPEDRGAVRLTSWGQGVLKARPVPLATESQKYMTVNTHKGLFKYKRLPFGVASAPSIFQRVMGTLLQGIAGVCVYPDDIVITGRSEQEHLHNLTQVLSRSRNASNMCIHAPVCLLPSHVISAKGLHTAESKVKAVVDAPELRKLRSFLGMVTYYGKFLSDLTTVLAPLYRLLRQTMPWTWGPEQRDAF